MLLDEIEKAHPEVLGVLLQILDDGRLTDGKGRTVDFKNCVIIMTSNLGSEVLLEGMDQNGQLNPDARQAVIGGLTQHFRPEFLNRIDDTIVFTPLVAGQMSAIAEKLIAEIRERMKDKGVDLAVTPAAVEQLGRDGFDPRFGARPLKRHLQRASGNAPSKASDRSGQGFRGCRYGGFSRG